MPEQVPAAERDRGASAAAATAATAQRRGGISGKSITWASSVGSVGCSSAGGRSAGGPASTSSSCTRRRRSTSSGDSPSVSTISSNSFMPAPLRAGRRGAASADRVRVLTVPSGMEELRHLALRETTPVREGDHFALAVGKFLECTMHAPGDPALLRRIGWLRFARDPLGDLGRDVGAVACTIDDRVAGDRIQPRSARPRSGL